MTKRYSEITSTIETHWSLFSAVRDNWGWIAAAFGLSGLNGWLLWLWQTALGTAHYQQALVIILGILVTGFLVLGIRAFISAHKRASKDINAIASGLSRSGHTYANGSIIEGGTHRLVEIFGADQLRSNLTFRNCQILGPGAVVYFNCHTEKSEYFGLPAVQFLDPRYSGNITGFLHQFMKCRFENCVFAGLVHIQRFPHDMVDSQVYRMILSSFEAAEWPTSPQGTPLQNRPSR